MLLLTAGVVSAQAQRPAYNAEQHKQRLEKRAFDQAKQMDLDDATTLWFSNLYVEYQTELRRIRQEARQAMPTPPKGNKDNADSTDDLDLKDKEMKKLSDEEAEKIIETRFKMEAQELATKQEYYKRFREKLSPKQLVRIFSPAPKGRQDWRAQRGQGGGGPMGPGFRPGGPMGRPF